MLRNSRKGNVETLAGTGTQQYCSNGRKHYVAGIMTMGPSSIALYWYN